MRDRFPTPAVNEQAGAKTRRQIRSQIALPTAVGVVALVAVVGTLLRGGVGTFSSWADISLILLLIPLFVLGLILGAVLLALLVAALTIYGEIPPVAFRILEAVQSLRSGADRVTQWMVRPFFLPSAVLAGIKRAVQSIRLIFYRP